MAELVEAAEEVGMLEEKAEVKRKRLALEPNQEVMTMAEAAVNSEHELARDDLAILMDYGTTHGQMIHKRKLVEILKLEVRTTAMRTSSGGGGKDGDRGSEGWTKKLDTKVVAHMKDTKFNGKDGGAGRTNSFEDLMVAAGTVDKELERRQNE